MFVALFRIRAIYYFDTVPVISLFIITFCGGDHISEVLASEFCNQEYYCEFYFLIKN
jgi:hypothetical protein